MLQTANIIIDHLSECPHCGLEIQRAAIGATAVEVWHETCWRSLLEPSTSIALTPAIAIEAPQPAKAALVRNPITGIGLVASAPRMRRRVMIASASAMALAMVGWFAIGSTAGASTSIEIEAREPVVWMDAATQPEVPNAAVDPLTIHKIPTFRGRPIFELYPTLATWTHPVVDTRLMLPDLSSGGFGAERDGIRRRRECGQGHCGNDINGPIGRPIVAVADGTVAHVDRSRLGHDKHSGRYVRIEHDDGTSTSYMHLNTIVAGLEPGDRVLAGQQIGTLGRTAIRSAPPHLHFALTVSTPNSSTERYIDPAPFLVRAKVIHAPDRRPPQKPVW